MTDRNTLSIVDEALVVIPRGMDRVWGFQKRIDVPLASIVDIQVEPTPLKVHTGLRYPGLDAYWKRSGTFHPKGERHYWNYSAPGDALMIKIAGGKPFHRLYLSVTNAEASRQMLTEAVKFA